MDILEGSDLKTKDKTYKTIKIKNSRSARAIVQRNHKHKPYIHKSNITAKKKKIQNQTIKYNFNKLHSKTQLKHRIPVALNSHAQSFIHRSLNSTTSSVQLVTLTFKLHLKVGHDIKTTRLK